MLPIALENIWNSIFYKYLFLLKVKMDVKSLEILEV